MPNADADPLSDAFDLNLMRFLRALIDTASVTRAGHAVGMSQPAASRATAKLRRRFGDPLLVRTAGGYVLTPLAQQLSPVVRCALSATEAVFEVAVFTARNSQRRFRVAATDYGTSIVLLPTIAGLRSEAPSIGLQIDPWTDQTVAQLERGELDCALHADEPTPPDFHARALFTDRYAVICKTGHALVRQSAGPPRKLLAAAAAYPQFAVRYPGQRGYVTDNVYRTLGLPGPRLIAEAPYFYAGARVVLDGDLVAVLPERAARLWARGCDLAVLPLHEPRLRFEYRVIWHERVHRDPGVGWLRDLIVRTTAVAL